MTIFKRSLLILGCAAAGLSAALIITVLVFMNSLYYEANAQGLRNTARLALSVIGAEQTASWFAANRADADIRRSIPDFAGGAYRLTLINTAGEVLWDSLVERELVNHLDREEVLAALEGREGSARRNSLSTGMRQMYAALPVFSADRQVAGVFRLSITIPSFWKRIETAALPFVLFALVLSAAAFAAIFLFSRSLADSMGRLVGIAHNAAGEPWFAESAAPAVTGTDQRAADEFLTLEKALRGMAAELKARLEQAQAEGSRLEAILNGMNEAVFATDAGFMLHLINPRARELFNLGGRNAQELSLLEATRSTELEDAARTVLANGKPLEMEMKLRSNQEQRFQVFAAPLAAGQGVVLVLQDTTRLVKLEQVRKDFVANVSHELRTPIQLMKGFSETLLESALDDTDQIRRFIEIISKSAHTMENLTNDLLILASLENSEEKGREMEEQRLAPLFAEAVSSVEPQAKKKQTVITVNCPAELTAKLHGGFIIQALINLLDNAIKYSPEGSSIQAEAREANDCLILEVKDQGIGIPAEHLGRIFERFYRVDRSRSREAGGTGLGLSIVRHIALLHNGSAEVESRSGQGSVFRIRIPPAG
jgi:two-component system phosphate regulon sensor histidine kinase PhoR